MPFNFFSFDIMKTLKGFFYILIGLFFMYIIFYIKNLNDEINILKENNKHLQVKIENLQVKNKLLQTKFNNLQFELSNKNEKEKVLSNINKIKTEISIIKLNKKSINENNETNDTSKSLKIKNLQDLKNLNEGSYQIIIK